MRQVEAEGKTREEAVEKALKELGVEMYEVDRIEVLDSGSRGIFGWGARPVRVRLTVEHLESPPPRPSRPQTAQQPRQKEGGGGPKSSPQHAGKSHPSARGGMPSGKPGANTPQQQQQKNKKQQTRPQQDKRRNDPPAFLKASGDRKQQNAPTRPPAKPEAHPQPVAVSGVEAAAVSPNTASAEQTPPSSVHHEALEALWRAEMFEKFEKGEIPVPPADENEAAGENQDPAEAPLSETELQRAETLLTELVTRMGFDARIVQGGMFDGIPRLIIETSQSGQVIGKNGRTLESLQYLLNRLIAPESALDLRDRIAVDCQGYLERKRRVLRDMAEKFARMAVSSGKIQRIKPLPPQERRIIHITLRDRADVTTSSEGNGYLRSVRVIPRQPRPDTQQSAPKRKNRHKRRRPGGQRPSGPAPTQQNPD